MELSNKMQKIIDQVPDAKKAIATDLAKEVDFMESNLETLKADILKYGNVFETKNGSQYFLKENPALKSYQGMVQRYSNVVRQLTALLPKEEKKKEVKNPVLDFVISDD